MEHHFNTEIAQKYGVNEAIFLNNIAHWILHNKANEKNFRENRYWTYNTARAFLNLFPYWSSQNLRTIINSCLRQKVIIKGNFNTRKSDRTLWYALSDEGLKLFPAIGKVDLNLVVDEDHLLESTNEVECGPQDVETQETPVASHLLVSTKPFVRINTALPYINTDNKQKIKDIGASKSKRPSRNENYIDPEFLPNATHFKLGSDLGINVHLERDKFVDHFLSKDEKKKDWDAAFRNWIRKSHEFKQKLNTCDNKTNNHQKNEIKSTVRFINDPLHPNYEQFQQMRSFNKPQKIS